MTRAAALDIGTNSQLLLVVEADSAGRRTICDLAVVTRLGEGIEHSNRLRSEAIARNLEQLASYKRKLDELSVERVVAVGTMCLRRAQNASEFIESAAREIGIQIEVVSGEEEARLTYRGVSSNLPDDCQRPLVFDLGGGSIEFVMGNRERLLKRLSLEAGAVLMTERFLHSDPARASEMQALSDHLVADVLEPLRAIGDFDLLLGVGGTVTSLGAMHLGLRSYDRDRIQGLQLTVRDISAQVEQLAGLDLAGRQQLAGLDPKRADIILAGALIVRDVCRLSGAGALTISDRGLRHGLLRERFGI